MYNELKNRNHRSLLDYAVLILFILIIYSNVTIIRGYLIFMLPLALLFLVIDVLLHKKKAYIKIIDKLWYLVFGYLLLSLIFSYEIKESLIYISYLLIMILIMTLLKSTRYIKHDLIKIFYVAAIVYSVITLSSLLVRDLIPNHFSFLFDSDRILMVRNEIRRGAFSGLAGEVSYNMFTISMGLGVVISNVIVSRKFSIKNIILVIIMIASLLLTQKRSVIVVLSLILIIMIIALKRNRIATKVVRKLILVLVVIGIILIIIIPDTLKVFNRFFEGGRLYLSGRDNLWDYAKGMFYDRPLFGYGIGTYNIYCNDMGYFSGAMHAHNIYLQLLAEVGIVGFMMFITVFVTSLAETIKIVRNAIKLSDNSALKVAALFSLYMQLFFLLYGIVGVPLYNYTQLFVYLIAISIGQHVKMEISYGRVIH